MEQDTTLDYERIGRSRARVAALLEELTATPAAAAESLEVLLVELNAAVEELLVAEEELRAQAEELAASRDAIDAERERYGDLFDFAPDAYLVTDDLGKIVEANGPASRMLGVPARWLEGKLLVSFVDERERRDLRVMIADLAQSPAQISERYLRMVPREGAPFMAAVRAASRPVRGQDSLGMRWMIRDVTQRLDMEEEIRFLHAEVDLLTTLNKVARLTAEPRPATATIGALVDLAARVLPGCEVSMALRADGSAADHLAASGDRARTLAEVEREKGVGPCAASVAAGEPLRRTVSECAEPWPDFAGVAVTLGLRDIIVHPLATPSGRRGCLTILSFEDNGALSAGLVPLLADQMVTALVNAELYESANGLALHLQRALESRGVIERAKGVLMGQQGYSDEEAFDILRRASQRTNRKLRDVAADLMAHVHTTDRPGATGDSGRGREPPMGPRPGEAAHRRQPLEIGDSAGPAPDGDSAAMN